MEQPFRDHPLIPGHHVLVGLRYEPGLCGAEAALELRLRREGEERHLRLVGPAHVTLEEAALAGGEVCVHVQEVPAPAMDGLGVRVADAEDLGLLELWARDVVLLHEQPGAPAPG